MNSLIDVERVSVCFDEREVVQHFSYDFCDEPGVTGLIGPNGAGKTTIINSLLGLVPISKGIVRKGHTDIAYCPDTPEFNPYLTAEETLEEAISLHGQIKPNNEVTQRILGKVGLQRSSKTYVGNYSRGMKQRLGIAAALILEPDILFLDEPTSALDPFGREAILDLIIDIANTIPVVFSSHILNDVQRVSKDLIVLNKGNLVYSGTMQAFLSEFGRSSVIRVKSPEGAKTVSNLLSQNGIKTSFINQEKIDISFSADEYDHAWGILADAVGHIVGFDRYSDSLWSAFSKIVQGNGEFEVKYD